MAVAMLRCGLQAQSRKRTGRNRYRPTPVCNEIQLMRKL
jgi:hypothetical protein